ncbi:MAG: glycoside hydrolase family 3 N-terminal domain-containing protein [Clostridia bacterium]|nr:glycoside hydrolase family 3 N-terminal domain-containing protein [Clostridia bacterium]
MKKKGKWIISTILLIIFFVCLGVLYCCTNNQFERMENGFETKKENEIFEEYYPAAEEIIKSMTLEEKAGQVLLARCPLIGANTDINSYNPGGYAIYSINLKGKSKLDVMKEINGYQKVSSIPMVIAVDEEGGTVSRVSRVFRNEIFSSPRSLYQQGGFEAILKEETEKISLLSSLGINLNLAPNVDISTDENDYMYYRSIGENADITALFAEKMTLLYNKRKMGMTLKHFPGYGNSKDTHDSIVIDDRSEEEFRQNDFLPFIAGINNGAQSIMVSHNILVWKDPDVPSSLSKPVHDILRDELGFTGVIITDDISMSGIKKYLEKDEEAVVLAINAGNDLISTSNFIEDREKIIRAVKNGQIKESVLNSAVRRVVAWKYYLGILK